MMIDDRFLGRSVCLLRRLDLSPLGTLDCFTQRRVAEADPSGAFGRPTLLRRGRRDLCQA